MPEIKNKLIQDMPSFIKEVYSDGCLMTKKKLDKSRNASVDNVYVISLVKTNKQNDIIAAESMIRPIIKSTFCCSSFSMFFPPNEINLAYLFYYNSSQIRSICYILYV